MPRPPDEDPFDDVLSQVEDALASLQLDTPETRAALSEGLREAFTALGIDAKGPSSPPEVVVLDGGLGPDTPSSESDNKPPLHIAPDLAEQEGVTKATVAFIAADDEEVGSASPTWTWSTDPTRPLAGTISVSGDDADWQTVFRGSTAQTYRLQVASGALEVALDGVVEERLTTGRTLDVCASLVRVRGVGGAATGAYHRA